IRLHDVREGLVRGVTGFRRHRHRLPRPEALSGGSRRIDDLGHHARVVRGIGEAPGVEREPEAVVDTVLLIAGSEELRGAGTGWNGEQEVVPARIVLVTADRALVHEPLPVAVDVGPEPPVTAAEGASDDIHVVVDPEVRYRKDIPVRGPLRDGARGKAPEDVEGA